MTTNDDTPIFPRKAILYQGIIIALLIVVTYANTLNHGFVWDDNTIIVGNPIFDKVSNIPRYFFIEDHAEGTTGYYRPITYASFALERSVWGMNPLGLNIDNLLLHVLVALLFYRLVAALFKREDLAFVAALIFALHPVAGETVNFHAGGRNTLLCATFTLLSFLAYIKGRRVSPVLWFLLAIFSKEFALLLPLFLFLYDRTIKEEKVKLTAYLPFAASIFVYLVLRSIAVEAHANLLGSLQLNRLLQIPSIVFNYLINLIFPFSLKTLYFRLNTNPGLLNSLLHFAVLAAVIAAGFVFSKRREILFSVAFFLIFLLPVMNIFPIGAIVMADRYAYLASFGFALAAAFLICLAEKKIRIALLSVLCVVYIGIVITRNGYWTNNITFFTQVVKDAPDHSIGYQNLGHAYYVAKDFNKAEKYLELATAQKDLNPSVLVGQAEMYWEMNHLDKAVAALNKKLELQPGNPQALIMASTIYEEMGEAAKAKEYRDKAIARFPRILEIMRQRAIGSCQQGEQTLAREDMPLDQRRSAAERLFKEALKIDPHFVPALIDLGNLCGEKGEIDRAITYFQKAAEYDPRNPIPYYNLALAHKVKGNMSESEAMMNKALALGGTK